MKKLVVLGAGESGIGTAILGMKQGYEVFVSDKGQIAHKYKSELETLGIEFEQGQHTEDKILQADEVMKSPGIPDKAEIIKKIRAKGIPTFSEIEFAARYTKANIIAITGSNGKTTTANLIAHLLKTGGLEVGLAGNVGYSFAKMVAEDDKAIYVLELSSFQLDGIDTFRPDVSILLNITPDHLDRYDYKMDHYVRSKFRIMMNQRKDDLFIYNKGDKEIGQFLKHRRLRMESLPVTEKLYKGGILRCKNKEKFSMLRAHLKGPHNWLNAYCAVEAALYFGVESKEIQTGLNTFINAPHRLESFANLNGVDYINDSKATNVDSVYWALLAMTKPVVLILGGLDKGNDYTQIEKLVSQKVKAIVCLGADNHKLLEFFSPIVKIIEETKSAKEAVQVANKYAEQGDVVLLSPACASFDLFKNYEDRGNQFKEAVKGENLKP